MKESVTRRAAACAFAALLTFGFAIVAAQSVTAQANSADLSWWEGSGTYGVYHLGGDCPLQVESETLNFYIDGMPYSDNTAQSYVTAEYNFYNPTATDVTARLVFPFGTMPDYYAEESPFYSDYAVTVNGADAGAEVRFTYHEEYYEFDYENESALLLDEKKTDGYFTEDTVIIPVTFTPQAFNNAENNFTFVSCTFDNTVRLLTDISYINGDGLLRTASTRAFTLYFAGSVPEDLTVYTCPQYYSYSKGYYTDYDSKNVLEATVGQQTTFGEFVQSLNPYSGAHAEVDWYNLCLDMTNAGYYYGEYGVSYEFLDAVNDDYIEYEIMRWYDYKMTVPAGGYTSNAVTAPLYPDVYARYTPNIYYYTYYLSPAQCWADFGTLTINVYAPYYMLSSSLQEEFTLSGSVEEGTSVYTLTVDGLPYGEFTFELCESENPEIGSGSGSSGVWLYIEHFVIIILITIAGYVIAAIVAVVLYCTVNNRRR